MSEVKFSGRVERIERDGFGIVRFDRSISGAEYGFFTEKTANLPDLLPELDVGTIVVGSCQTGAGDIRAVESISLPGTDSGPFRGEERPRR